MIILYHNNSKITQIVSSKKETVTDGVNQNIVVVLLDYAVKFKDEIIVWCHESEKSNLNIAGIESLFHHKKMLFSYSSSSKNYFDSRLGYIEDSPFVNVNKDVSYATWQMSSCVGAVHTTVLNSCIKDLKIEKDFDYFLNSFARRAMNAGLLCYSEPKLLLQKTVCNEQKKSNLFEFFKFTKQHYKTRWIFLLFLNLLVFEKRFPLFPLIVSLFYKKRHLNPEFLNQILLESNKKIVQQGTIDVLIPTIGRKEHLLQVLKNLATQTYLPKTVIIIEQNQDEKAKSDLDFIESTTWPFVIKHHFTHKTGVCNARNIGLSLIESEFIFFADDDIVFENDLLKNAIQTFKSMGNEVFLVACHLKSQVVIPKVPKQFAFFGAGHAFVKSSCVKDLKFNTAYEFGFGEDNDFGMQLRNKGFDILYISTSKILHLKAPIGGFRSKPILKWSHEKIQPKPSPTIMLYKLLHNTKQEILGYKTTLFFKFYKSQSVKNPIKYYKTFKKQWGSSTFWANELLRKHEY